MRLKVRFRHFTDCNVTLPRHIANTLTPSYCKPKAIGLVITWAAADGEGRIRGRGGQALVGWSGTCSASREDVEISAHLARSLGLAEGQSVNVEPAAGGAIATATTVLVEPATEDDWEVIELHAAFLEERLLQQVQFVFEGETIPLWVAGDTVAFVTITKVAGADVSPKSGAGGGTFARIAQDGQVIVAPKPRPIPKIDADRAASCRLWLRVLHPMQQHHKAGYVGLVNPADVPRQRLFIARTTKTKVRSVESPSVAPGEKREAAVVRLVPAESVQRGTVALDEEASLALGCRAHEIVFFENLAALPQPTRVDKVVVQELRIPGTSAPTVPDAGSQQQRTQDASVAAFKAWFAANIGASQEPVAHCPEFVVKMSDGRAFCAFINCDPPAPIPGVGSTTAVSPSAGATGNVVDLHPSSIHSATQFSVAKEVREGVPFNDASHPDLREAFLEDRLGGYEREFRTAAEYVGTCAGPGASDLRLSLRAGARGLPALLIVGGRSTGRTTFALTLAGSLSRAATTNAFVSFLPCTRISSATVVRGRGETPTETVRRMLWECIRNAPAVLVLDDIDALVPGSSGGQSEDEQSVVDIQAARELRELFSCAGEEYGPGSRLSIIATAQSLSSIHTSLQGTSVFGAVVELLPPSKAARRQILEKAFAKLAAPLSADVDLWKAALSTEGCVAGDLVRIAERAHHEMLSRRARNRSEDPTQPAESSVAQGDVAAAIAGFTPMSLMGVKALPTSDITWEDVGGLGQVKNRLKETLEWPAKFPQLFENCPIRLRSGILLYGPPGCGLHFFLESNLSPLSQEWPSTGKTLLAQAVARECSLNFISVKGPELLSKYIGQSELAVRDLFRRAQAARPSILFFDEFDALAPRRGHDTTGVTDRVVNQLLTQLDGVEALSGVYVLAASSRPDLIDPALLRPGRIDLCLYCGFPTKDERTEILAAITRKTALSPEVNLTKISEWCEGKELTPADLRAAVYSAQLAAVKEAIAQCSAPSDQWDKEHQEFEVIQPGTAASSDIERVLAGSSEPIQATRQTPNPLITEAQLMEALSATRPSISAHERHHYGLIYAEFLRSRTGVAPDAQSQRFLQPKQTLA